MDRRNFLAFSVVTPLVVACGGGDDNPPGTGISAGQNRANAMTAAGTNPSFESGRKRVLSWNSAGNWMMDGASFQFFGAEIHPSRVPSQYWDHRIKMIKALGCNTISLYVMWNFHELSDGTFDFSSPDKDIGRFVDLCVANNMWVLLRPGPYVNAEWDFGGLPPRMLADPQFRDSGDLQGDLQIRGNFPAYMAAVQKWNAALYANVIEGRTLASGGPIMLVAMEDEYSDFWDPVDPNHLTALASQWTSLGYAEKFCVCEGTANGFKDQNIRLPANTAYGISLQGKYESSHIEATKNYGVASFGAEIYPGWLCNWGDPAQDIRDDNFASSVVGALTKAGRSIVIYVGHGGTSFGFTAGCDGEAAKECQPLMTSYDYGAPVAENGLPNKNFQPIQAAYAANTSFGVSAGPVPAPPIDSIADGEVASISSNQFVFSDFLSNVSPTIENSQPQTIEWIALTLNKGQPVNAGIYPAGVAVYQTTLPSGGNFTVGFSRPPDFALAFINGTRVTSNVLTTVKKEEENKESKLPSSSVTTFDIDDAPPGAMLQIVCMPFGRANVNSSAMKKDGRGLSGNVTLSGSALTDWKMALAPLSAAQLAALPFDASAPTSARPFFAKATFAIETPKDMYIDMSSWGIGYVFVNGRNLGRYWPSVGPQTRLYCPGVWLNSGGNTIVVFEFTQASAGSLSFFGSSNLPYNIKSD
ncbi:beta-galactosidase [Burkholderia sp. BKH01]|uniref:beta-galactosidase n=1 Tax=Burkholderia sp. BKH01 TaxID=2769262 RepID=UPI0021E0EAD7|nr:beta-galactosidase [Burkholderia sp. BKH01]MCU9951924.1 beta-galactosidase [Burkholderia sp. BKH01]